MMKLKLLLRGCAALAAMLPAVCSAQNLVPNPDFELHTNCPADLGEVDVIGLPQMFNTVTSWYRVHEGTTDYYHECGTSPASVPFGYHGYQEPRSGQAYMGIISTGENGTWSEYIEAQLLQPLVAGVTYQVSFWVNNSSDASLVTDCLGAYFSQNPVTAPAGATNMLSLTPQIQSPPGVYFSDTLNWMEVSGTFVAAGGEQYITIGLFDGGAPYSIALGTGWGFGRAYVLIDDVSVTSLSPPVAHDTVVCGFGASLDLTSLNTGSSYLWNTGATTNTIAATQSGTYWVQTTTAGGAATDTFRVSLASLPDLGPDILKCPESAVTLATLSGYGYDAYLWNTGDSTASITVAQPGQYMLTVHAGACVETDTVVVSNRPDAIVDLGPDRSACEGDTVVLSGPAGYSSYLWSTGEQASSIVVTQGGRYWLLAGSDCFGLDTVEVTFAPLPPAPVVSPEIAFCEGTLSPVLPVEGQNLIWYPNPQSASGSPDQPPVYTHMPGAVQTFTVSQTVAGCEGPRITFQVTIDPAIAVELGPDIILCEGHFALLDAGNDGDRYAWSTGATQPGIEVFAAGAYSVAVYRGACMARDTVVVVVEDCGGCVRLANAFTPNADGINDRLTPLITCPETDFALRIFNRWGQQVFYTTTPGEAWDGSFQGRPCPTGVYYYLLEYSSKKYLKEKKLKKGDITLLR